MIPGIGFKGGPLKSRRIINISDYQLMTAYAKDRVLFSLDYGLTWEEMKTYPFSLSSYPLIGGAFRSISGYNYFFLANKTNTYRKRPAANWAYKAKYPTSSDPDSAKGGMGMLSYVESDASNVSLMWGAVLGYYRRLVAGAPVLYHGSITTNGTYGWGLFLKSNGVYILDGGDSSLIHPSYVPLAGVNLRLAHGYTNASNPRTFYIFVVNSSGNVTEYADISEDGNIDNTITRGTIGGFTSNNSYYKNYIFDSDKKPTSSSSKMLVATEKIWISQNRGASWTQKVSLSGYARDGRVSGSPFSGEGIYMLVVTNNGQIWLSQDYGSTWAKRYDDSAVEFVGCDIYGSSISNFDVDTFFSSQNG